MAKLDDLRKQFQAAPRASVEPADVAVAEHPAAIVYHYEDDGCVEAHMSMAIEDEPIPSKGGGRYPAHPPKLPPAKEPGRMSEDDLRALFAPPAPKKTATGIDLGKMRDAKRSRGMPKGARGSEHRAARFTVSTDGRDAVLHFGQYNGHSLSDVVKANFTYLEWLCKDSMDFPKALKDIARHILAEFNAKRSRK